MFVWTVEEQDILGQVACSSVSKWTGGDMAIGMVGQPGWRFGMKQTCSLLLGDMPTAACSGLTGEN